jgi:hypothetical protein
MLESDFLERASGHVILLRVCETRKIAIDAGTQTEPPVIEASLSSAEPHKLTCRGRCNDYMPRETEMRPRSSSAT